MFYYLCVSKICDLNVQFSHHPVAFVLGCTVPVSLEKERKKEESKKKAMLV